MKNLSRKLITLLFGKIIDFGILFQISPILAGSYCNYYSPNRVERIKHTCLKNIYPNTFIIKSKG